MDNTTYDYNNYQTQPYLNSTPDVMNSNYYFPNNQYLYYNNYGNYYQTQFNPLNYGQYSYYPNYNYSTPSTDDSVNGSSINDKIDTTANTSSNENSIASSGSNSTENDYISANASVSPIPTLTKSTEQSTPISAILVNSQSLTSRAPPELSDNENNKEKKLTKIERSPEVIPRDDSNDEQNDDLQSQSRMKRRTRTQFTKYQIDTLESVFIKNHYPDVQTVDLLAEKLGLAIERISVWFQNRRAKFKKTKKPSNFSVERLYSEDRNSKSVSLSKKDPVAFQTFANHLAPKPAYTFNGVQYENQQWPSFNPSLIGDRFRN